eukprot:TRINITY_DN9219_c0_g1_i10.p1 TRINITY_DN9219_c0_g1~~TRINITY_DN9219_c0_g1_i10.p1  ORF type:complete len:366 (+),score=50.76 TRINITY_DN9219_c0_g1_i10:121-1218(+)
MRCQGVNEGMHSGRYEYEYLSTLNGVEAKAVGTLLGCMCGDTVGSAVEGYELAFRYHDVIDEDKVPVRGYTDDTEMTYGLAKSIIRTGYCDAADACKAYTEEFHENRGYSSGTRRLFLLIKHGELTYQNSGTHFFKDGSFANGGAMRISPLSLAYRNASPQKLLEGVKNALYCTHRHPGGVDGAYAQALAVQWLLNHDLQKTVQNENENRLLPVRLVQHIRENVQTEEMQSRLDKILRALQQLEQRQMLNVNEGYNWEGDCDDPQWQFDTQLLDSISQSFQISAVDAASCALYASCRHNEQPLDAVKGAISYGGDTDTVGAMAGAMVGALHGCNWIPQVWWNQLEVQMRDQLIDSALALANMNVS